MKKLLYGLFIAIIVILTLSPIVVGLTDYKYSVQVTIANSTASDITGRYVFTINAAGLISGNFIQSDADDVRIAEETASVAQSSTIGELANAGAYWYTDYITVPANGSIIKTIWLSNSAATARNQMWIADDADTNVVADAAELDIQDNLTLTAKVNVSSLPATEKEIISKKGNYELTLDAANYNMRVWKTASNLVLRPNAAGDSNALLHKGGAAGDANNYTEVDEAVADDAATYVYAPNGNSGLDLYNLPASGLSANVYITSVTLYWRGYTTFVSAGQNYSQGYIKTGGTAYNAGSTIDEALAWTTHNYTWSINPKTSDRWTIADIDALQIGVLDNNITAVEVGCTQVYIEVAYAQEYTASIAASTGEKTVTGTYKSADNQVSINIGGAPQTTALTGNLYTNAEPVHIALLDGKVDDVKIGTTSIVAPTWETDFTFEASDISGTGANTTVVDHGVAPANPMTSTRTGNPAGITVTLGAMIPVTPGSVPIVSQQALVTDAAKEFNPQNFTIPEAGSNLTNAQIPGLIIDSASRVSNVDTHWIWWFTYGITCVVLFLIGIRFLGGHITIAWVMVIVATALFVSWSVVPWWFIAIYAIFAMGSLAWENRTTI